jgi:hypothetical protein
MFSTLIREGAVLRIILIIFAFVPAISFAQTNEIKVYGVGIAASGVSSQLPTAQYDPGKRTQNTKQ